MTVLTDALAHPNVKRIFLAEVSAGQHLTFWTLNSGSTYYAATTYTVTGVEENGAALTSRASVALVDANPGSYFFDAAAGRVYVLCTASANPNTKTLQAQVRFTFASHAKTFNNEYYEPRIESAPGLSLRVERKFTGVSQVGGGSLGLENHDGWFDALTGLYWDAGSVTVAFGVDRPGISTMAYGDYAIVGTWRVTGWNKDDGKFTLTLKEKKTAITKKIPTAIYDRATYAGARESDIGKAIPIAYGVVKDIKPACIDLSTRRFKVAGHAIAGFDALRVKNTTTGAWDDKAFASTDLALGEFTVGSADWSDGKEIAVDFRGKAVGGVLMDNAADIIEDLLTVELSEPSANLNAASFTAAWAKLDIGAVFSSSARATLGKIGVFLDKATEGRSVIETINLAVGSYLFSDSSGLFYYRVFEPVVGEGLTELTEKDIYSFSETTDSDAVYSKISVRYNKRALQDWAESYVYEIPERQYLHDQPEPALLEKDAVLSATADAQRLGQRLGFQEGRPARSWKLSAPARLLLTKLPGDFLHMTYPRHALDAVVEILDINHDLMGDKSTLTVSDAHGLGDRAGFWVGDADALPTRFAGLAGYGSGSLVWNASWAAEIKTWARQNVGYWTNDYGLASTADTNSQHASAWT